SEAEFSALVEDIKTRGLRQPVVTMEDGDGNRILVDGIHRLDALQIADPAAIAPNNYNVFAKPLPTMPEAEIVALVSSLNIHRRHLTGEQRRELIAKVLKANPEKSDRQVAGTVKASPTPVGKVRAKLEANGDVSNLDTRTDTKGRKQP